MTAELDDDDISSTSLSGSFLVDLLAVDLIDGNPIGLLMCFGSVTM